MIALSILPVFLVLLLGWVCRKKAFPSADFWEPAERIIYYMLIPCLFFNITSKTDFSGGDTLVVPAVAGIAIAILTVVLLGMQVIRKGDGPAFTSVVQGSTRFNAYIMLSVLGIMFGEQGLLNAAITIAVMVPILNIICVFVLVNYGESDSPSGIRRIVTQVCKNPLVVSSLLGGTVNFLNIPIPNFIAEPIEILSRAALPLGLMAVGAGLKLHALKGAGNATMFTNGLKLLVLPLLALGVAIMLEVAPLQLQIAVIFAASPTATAGYILARQMGGNVSMILSMIISQTLFSMLTLPVWAIILQTWFPVSDGCCVGNAFADAISWL